MFELMQDLGDMGESNAVIGRYVLNDTLEPSLRKASRHFLHRDTLMAASVAYQGNNLLSIICNANWPS